MLPENSSIIDIESYKNSNGDPQIKGKNSYYRLDYYTEAIYEEKVFVRFVKNIEKIVRRSNEYSNIVYDLKVNKGLNACAILNNIKDSNEDESMATIEMHHYPFTLYDICSAVLEKMLFNKEKVSSFLVAKKVIELHNDNKIGIVPLCKTVHELAHAGKVFINLNLVYGYYDKFIEEYKDFFPDGLLDTYNKIVEMSKNNIVYSEEDILSYKGINNK